MYIICRKGKNREGTKKTVQEGELYTRDNIHETFLTPSLLIVSLNTMLEFRTWLLVKLSFFRRKFKQPQKAGTNFGPAKKDRTINKQSIVNYL